MSQPPPLLHPHPCRPPPACPHPYAAGEYSEAFVAEFKLFTQELRDFFSAGSLTDMLAVVRPSLDDAG